MASWEWSRGESSDDMVNGRNHDPILHRIETLERELKQVRDDVVDIDKTLAGMDVRLGNGRQVFADQDRRIAGVESAVAPRPVSIFKVVTITLGAISLAAAALWGLSERLADRPTLEQMDNMMEKHDGGGHPELRKTVTEIEVGQRRVLKKIEDSELKLDDVLERLPKPPKRRRRRR